MNSCLNPCFNGRYSQSLRDLVAFHTPSQVLILVLMEDTLRAVGVASKENRNGVVLILVLMEDTLREYTF